MTKENLWTDTHCHLASTELFPNIDMLVKNAKKVGIGRLVNICTDLDSLEKGLAAAEKYSGFFNAASTTPQDAAGKEDPFFPFVEKAVKDRKLVAVGETGLDYYYGQETKEAQHIHLTRYLHLAARAGLPAIFHCRAAFDDLYSITDKEFSNHIALMHCFTGSKEDAKKAIDRGWLISLSGVITFKKSDALRDVIRYIPMESIVVETDSPYLAPLPYRGKPNEPAYIVETGKMLAEIKGISVEECARITTENASKLFSFSNSI